MITKSNILDFVKHVHKRERGIPDRRPMHPRRDWLIGLLLFVVVTAGGAVMSIRSFELYKNIDQRDYSVDITVPNYNQTAAQSVLEEFAAREARYELLASEVVPPPVADTATTTATSSDVVATSSDETALETDETDVDGSVDLETDVNEVVE